MTIQTTSNLADPVKALYNAAALQAFTERGQFWRSATIRKVEEGLDLKGKAKKVLFDLWIPQIYKDKTTLAMSQVEVAMQEYGNYLQTTRKLRLTNYGEQEEHAAWNMGQMASDTIDLLAREAMDGQGALCFSGAATATNEVTIDDKLTADDVKKAFADLRAKNVTPLEGGYYLAFIHPHVLKDLRDETGDGPWTVKELYAGERIQPIMDEVGTFEGFRFILSASAKITAHAGAPTGGGSINSDVYTTYFIGKDAIGFAQDGEVPMIEVSEPNIGPEDAFRRFQIISWYALCGFGILNEDALYKIHSSSSLSANGD